MMAKSKAFSFLASSRADNPPNLIRWLIILATVGLVGSLAIGLLLKHQSANAQSSSVKMLPIADAAFTLPHTN